MFFCPPSILLFRLHSLLYALHNKTADKQKSFEKWVSIYFQLPNCVKILIIEENMKTYKISAVILTSVVGFGGLPSIANADLLGQAGSTIDAVQKTSSAISNVQKTVETAKAVSEVSQNGLVDTLVSQLGVTPDQATGGSSALFNMAKSQMTDSDFSEVSKGVPGMDGLLGAKPKTETSASGSLLNSAAALSGNSSLSNAASLANSFEQLNMSKDMVSKFTPVIVDYVNKNTGGIGGNLLKSAFSMF